MRFSIFLNLLRSPPVKLSVIISVSNLVGHFGSNSLNRLNHLRYKSQGPKDKEKEKDKEKQVKCFKCNKLNWFHAMGAGVAINDGRPVLTFSAESIFLDNPSHDIEIDDDMEEEMFLAEIYDEDGNTYFWFL